MSSLTSPSFEGAKRHFFHGEPPPISNSISVPSAGVVEKVDGEKLAELLTPYGDFFDATDVHTWTHGQNTVYRVIEPGKILLPELELSIDPNERLQQLRGWSLIKVPVRDEMNGTISSHYQLCRKEDIHTIHLGDRSLFSDVGSPLQLAHQVYSDVVRFPIENKTAIVHHFSELKKQALKLGGSSQEETIRNVYKYLTQNMSHERNKEHYFQRMGRGMWNYVEKNSVDEFGTLYRYLKNDPRWSVTPGAVGIISHGIRSWIHALTTVPRNDAESGIASLDRNEGTGRGFTGTMLYMLAWNGINHVNGVIGFAPDEHLGHVHSFTPYFRSTRTTSYSARKSVEHSWIRIGNTHYDPARDFGKDEKDWNWFRKSQPDMLSDWHEWYGLTPTGTRDFLGCMIRKWGPILGLLVAALFTQHMSSKPNAQPIKPTPIVAPPPVTPPVVIPPAVKVLPLSDDDEHSVYFYNLNTGKTKNLKGNVLDNTHNKQPSKTYTVTSCVLNGQRMPLNTDMIIKSKNGNFVFNMNQNGNWEISKYKDTFLGSGYDYDPSAKGDDSVFNISYTVSDGSQQDDSVLTLNTKMSPPLEIIEQVDNDIDKLFALLDQKGLSEIPEAEKRARSVIIDRSGSMAGPGNENMKYITLFIARLSEKFKTPISVFAYDDESVEHLLKFDDFAKTGLTPDLSSNILRGLSPRGAENPQMALDVAAKDIADYQRNHPEYTGKGEVVCFADGGSFDGLKRPTNIVRMKGFEVGNVVYGMQQFFGQKDTTSLATVGDILVPENRQTILTKLLKSLLPPSVVRKIDIDSIYSDR